MKALKKINIPKSSTSLSNALQCEQVSAQEYDFIKLILPTLVFLRFIPGDGSPVSVLEKNSKMNRSKP